MMSVLGVPRKVALVGVSCAGLLLGCSFIAEPPPGSANELRPHGDGYRCGKSWWYPLGDTVSTVASVTWIVRANNELETAGEDQASLWHATRVAGWAGVGLFGASAIYGYVVEGRCAQLRKNHELEVSAASAAASAPSTPNRANFPGSVFGFGFRMQRGDLVQLCLSKNGQWTVEGAVGVCRQKVESSSFPEVRIGFQLGVPSEIRTIFSGSVQTKNRDYQALASGLRNSYGPPQVEGAALSPSCQASLAQCLESVERPKDPVWHWPSGTIELTPIWVDQRALLEIRYTSEDGT